jgi:hypothetical protein
MLTRLVATLRMLSTGFLCESSGKQLPDVMNSCFGKWNAFFVVLMIREIRSAE